MAFSPIAFIAPNYRDFKTNWLKAYEPGTTTPKTMALDSTGSVLAIKVQLNADGFIESAGGALVIPYINGAYDLWLFPNEPDADANDTSSALRVADDITSGVNNENTLTHVEDNQILIAGQLIVNFSGITVDRANIYIGKNSGDRGKLFLGDDYTLTGVSQITLTSSFSAGTKLVAESAELVDRVESIKPMTLAEAVSNSAALEGQIVQVTDRADGQFTYLTGHTPNTFNIVAADKATLDLVLRQENDTYGKEWGLVGDGVADDTLAFRAALAYAIANRGIFYPQTPDVAYLITDSISIPKWAKIQGEKTEQYSDGFGEDPRTTNINFAPTTPKTLFVSDGTSHTGFRFYQSLKGMFLKSTNTNGAIGFDADGCIYGSFSDLTFEDFDIGIYCKATINNSFRDVYISANNTCIHYDGTIETTDVWDKCSLFGTPLGVDFDGSTVGIRFTNCLFEQLNVIAQLDRETQTASFVNCYAEDICFDGVALNAAFKVGTTGSVTVLTTHLTITGGAYHGRNAGTVGAFLRCDHSKSILISDVTVVRFTDAILTSANTQNSSIGLSNFATKSVTNPVGSGDLSKINGTYGHGNIEDIGYQQRTKMEVCLIDEVRPVDAAAGTRFGRTGEKLSLFGAATVLQPSSTGETVGFTAGGGTGVTSASTFTGNVGSTAYRVSDIVKALKQVGLLAE